MNEKEGKRSSKKKKKRNSPAMQQKRICGRVTFCFLHPLMIPFSHLAKQRNSGSGLNPPAQFPEITTHSNDTKTPLMLISCQALLCFHLLRRLLINK